MYTLTGTPLDSITPAVSKKTPVITEVKSTNLYQSSQNDPIPEINNSSKSSRMLEYMDSNLESLLKEQVFLMKFILLFLGFMLLSNILTKKN